MQNQKWKTPQNVSCIWLYLELNLSAHKSNKSLSSHKISNPNIYTLASRAVVIGLSGGLAKILKFDLLSQLRWCEFYFPRGIWFPNTEQYFLLTSDTTERERDGWVRQFIIPQQTFLIKIGSQSGRGGVGEEWKYYVRSFVKTCLWKVNMRAGKEGCNLRILFQKFARNED